MHSWRWIPRCAAVTASVALVATGLFLSGAQDDGQHDSARTTAIGQPAAPESTPLAAPDRAVPQTASKAPVVTDQQTVVPAVTSGPSAPGKSRVVAELAKTTTKNFGTVGVTWSAATQETDVSVAIRTRANGNWSAWESLDLDDPSAGGRPGTEPIWVGAADGIAARVRTASGNTPEDIKVMTIDAGKTSSDANLTAVTPASSTEPGATAVSSAAFVTNSVIDGTARATAVASSTALPPQPAIILRSAWGAAKPTPCDAPQTVSKTKGAVIHHTAGTNTYTQDQSAAIVRGDQAYHMKARKWCDIGYNFIVDKYGQIFEGRAGGITKQVRAAHSGNNEVNTYAMGVALAGNFGTVAEGNKDQTGPSVAMQDAAVKLVAWRFGQMGLKAKGTWHVNSTLTGTYDRIDTHTLNLISGHRNVVGTACPGILAYQWLGAVGGLRDRVEQALNGKATSAPAPASSTNPSTTRLWGTNRYLTAVAISAKTFSPGVNAVFVSTGTGFADGLSGGPGAAKLGAPLLLTPSDSLLGAVATEIRRLKPKKIYLLGGEAVVKPAVRDALGTIAQTKRLYGQNRYATSASASTLWSSANTVYLASGMGFADALSGGAAAARANSPLLLTATDNLPVETEAALKRLKPANVVLVGGEAAISKGVQNAVKRLPGVTVSRIGGVDRYDTSAKLLRSSWSGTISKLMLASGATFADALSGVPASTAMGSAFALTGKQCMAPGVAQAKGPDVSAYVLLGGKSVLDTAVAKTICSPQPDATTSSSENSTGTKDTVVIPSSRTVTLTGHGYGHGIGMGQYGAQGAAKKGLAYDAILRYYYPGTTLASKSGNIRVLVSRDTDPSGAIKAQSGLSVRLLANNKVITLPTTIGGASVLYWQIVPSPAKGTVSMLRYKTTSWAYYDQPAWSGDSQFEAGSAPISLILPDNSQVKYRGALRSAIPKAGSSDRNTVNVVSIEDYTRGVVAAEMPSSWEPAALRAQSVAARTYGVRSMTSSRYYDICDTTACQVYGGVARETTSSDAAVRATSTKILTYGGAPAFTQFSSSSGGWSEAGSAPYLKAQQDIYDDWSGNYVHTWTFSLKAATLEKKYATIGTLKGIRITKRNGRGDWGGRVTSVSLTGSKATKTLTGNDMRWALGLRSNWFRFN